LAVLIVVSSDAIISPTALASAYEDWPRVDSLTIDNDYFIAGVDTVSVTAYIYNPDPSHDFTIPVQLRVSNGPLEYEYASSYEEVFVPANTQVTTQFLWADTAAIAFLEYDLGIEMLFESGSQANVVTNGDFEGGLGGWTLINNNPPGYGVEHGTIEDGDGDGEAHVYMTQYDTYGIQPEIYQTVTLPAPDSFAHLRFKCTTDDILYGVGVAIVYLKRGPGELVFWHSTAAKPPDTSTRHYVRVFESTWQNVAVTMDSIPSGSGDQLTIGAKAVMQTSMPYAMVEVDIYLDDIGVCDDNPTTRSLYAAYIWTGLDTETIGDYRAALQDCLTETFPDLGLVERAVPLVSTVHMWDNFYSNMCAAGVYQDVPGKAREKNLAMIRGTYSLFEGPLDLLSLAMLVGSFSKKALIEHGVTELLETAALDYVDGQTWGDAESWDEAKDAVTDLTKTAGEGYRDEVLVQGAGDLRVSPADLEGLGIKQSGDAYVSADTLGMTGCWVSIVSPDTLSWASVSDQPKVLLQPEPLSRRDPVRFTFTASDSGPVNFFVRHSGAFGEGDVSLDDVVLEGGDIVYVDADDSTEVFQFQVDYGGDGAVDTVYEVSVLAGLEQNTPVTGFGIDLSVDPTPSASAAVLNVTNRIHGPVAVKVYDIEGRAVITLLDAVSEPGLHCLTWNGKDERDNDVSPGVYFVRAEAGRHQAIRKIILTR
jgi:hypothetical protein